MIGKKHTLLLALLSICSLSLASEVWGDMQNRIDDQLHDIEKTIKDEIALEHHNMQKDHSYLGTGLSEMDLEKDIEKIKAINSNDDLSWDERAEATKKVAEEEDEKNTFDIYAEYRYMNKKFYLDLLERLNITNKNFSHHYPYTGGSREDVLPKATKKVKTYLEETYYPIQAMGALVDALDPNKVQANGGKVVYQSNDPNNQIDFEKEMGLGRSENQSFEDYMHGRSTSMNKKHGFLSKGRSAADFEGIISRLLADFAKSKAEMMLRQSAGYSALPGGPFSWVPSCRTVLCMTGGGYAGGGDCPLQMSTYQAYTNSGTPPEVIAKKIAWLVQCPIIVAAKENSLMYVIEELAKAKSIFNFDIGSDNNDSGEINLTKLVNKIEASGNNQNDSYIPEVDFSSIINLNEIAQSTHETYNTMNQFNEMFIYNKVDLRCKPEVYNLRNRTIRFNWSNPTKNNAVNPLHIIEAEVIDDQLSDICQQYVDHVYTNIYQNPIYHRWVSVGYSANSSKIVFNNKWLSDEALSHYEDNIKDKNNRTATNIKGRELFGRYYNYVDSGIPESIKNNTFNIKQISRQIKEARNDKNFRHLKDANTFEKFATSINFGNQPVYDFIRGINYYFGEWRLVKEYEGRNTLVNDYWSDGEISNIEKEVHSYGKESDVNSAQQAREQRKKNKEIMQQELKEYNELQL